MDTINDNRRALVSRFGHAHFVMTLHYLKRRKQVGPRLAFSDVYDSLLEDESPGECPSDLSHSLLPCVNCQVAVASPAHHQKVYGSNMKAYGLLREWQDLDRTGALTAHLAALDRSLIL